ncbi:MULTISPECIES: hypothetical protein [unclassified Luteococcus]|uniref:hypothetical protein n=1 Tax=unclassified Luteococcus TaxID=2639923 RepID=UPI00313D50E1
MSDAATRARGIHAYHALADEVNRLRAALHLRDTTQKPPEAAMWHWSLISNSDYAKVCAENARLRALTTVDEVMVERAAKVLSDEGADSEGGWHSWRCFDGARYPEPCTCTQEAARLALEAALGVEL